MEFFFVFGHTHLYSLFYFVMLVRFHMILWAGLVEIYFVYKGMNERRSRPGKNWDSWWWSLKTCTYCDTFFFEVKKQEIEHF